MNPTRIDVMPIPKFGAENMSHTITTKSEDRIHLNKFKEIRTELFEVVEKMVNTPYIALKVYLLIFVIISSGLASYLVVESALNYLSYDVITTARTIYETPTLFPQITICNTNMFTTDYAFQIYKQAASIASPTLSVFNSTQMSKLSLTNKVNLFMKIYLTMSAKVNDRNFSDENRKRIGHRIEDILIDCKFNYKTCYPSDFTWSFDPNFGNCYMFNSGRNQSGSPVELKQSSVAGVLFGLQLKYYAYYNENLIMFNAYHGGIGGSIRIDNSSYLTDHIFDR